MEILGKILGSSARVKVMRLFLVNKGKNFKNKDVAARCRISSDTARKELNLLSSTGFIKKRGQDWSFNYDFKYGPEIENLLISTDTVDKEALSDGFKKAGKMKLLVASGIFIKNKDSRVDLLIVGDKMKRGRIEEEIRKLEAEIGAELVYAVFETKEFVYRLNMYDKLIRDILDFPHEVVFQAKELSTQALKKA
ncbi:MAG TPA: hypothetical protein VJB95_01405 [Candidatus Paceibacterota bacterium]